MEKQKTLSQEDITRNFEEQEISYTQPDPKKSAVEQFSQKLTFEDLAARRDHLLDAVKDCKRPTKDLNKEYEMMSNTFSDIFLLILNYFRGQSERNRLRKRDQHKESQEGGRLGTTH